MTFRARLLRVILGLVAATTAACLLIALQQGSRTHGRMLNRLFGQQMEGFHREQELQLVNSADRARLAESVRLFAALEAADPETYKIAADELRLVQFDFFRLATATGEIIPPPEDSRAGLMATPVQEGLHRQLKLEPVTAAADASVPAASSAIQFGYVDLTEADIPRIYRVLACPITGFDSTVGTLFLGQRLDQFNRPVKPAHDDDQDVLPALWLQGHLLGDRVPTALREMLTPVLQLKEPNAGPQTVEAAGVRYKVQTDVLNPGSTFPPAVLVSCFSLAEYDAQQRLLLFRVIGLGALALLIATGIAWVMARQIGEPIASLVSATQEIRKGNYQPPVKAGKTIEFTRLATAFQEMGAGLALKDRYHSILGQVTDEQVAEELLSGAIRLGGELRDVTVIFCDIRGYTALSAGRDPVEVIEILNAHMGALIRIVRSCRGVINQFAGDAIMILFGAPKSYGDDAARAVRCAWDMMRERERLNETAREPLRIGIGVASGSVVAGCIGGEQRSEYTVVGERVNLAARLCSSAAAGQILVDDTTLRQLPPGYVCQALPPLTLKGFAEPVPAHLVTSLSESPA